MNAESRERFSLRHAYTMVLAWLLALSSGRTLPVALLAVLSLAVWLWELRDEFPKLADFGSANIVTSLRALSLFGLALSIDSGAPGWAVAWALWIFTLDGIDGLLARRAGKETLFGARFDLETDASMMLLLACGLFQLGRAGVWVCIAGLLRFVYVLALHWSQRPDIPPPRSRFGRHAFSIAVTCFMFSFWPPQLQRISELLALMATGTLCYSFSRSFRSSFAPRSA